MRYPVLFDCPGDLMGKNHMIRYSDDTVLIGDRKNARYSRQSIKIKIDHLNRTHKIILIHLRALNNLEMSH